jgi:hypothetical protein
VNAYLRIVDTLDTEIELAGGWIAAGLATDPSDRRLGPSSTTGRVGHHREPSPHDDPALRSVIAEPLTEKPNGAYFPFQLIN